MMTRPFALGLAAACSAALLTGCNSVQLPEGYAWNVSPEKQNDFDSPRGAYRYGFDQSRINESLPATSRDRTNYDYAAVLPRPAAGVRPPYEPNFRQPGPAASAGPDALYTALDPVPAPGGSVTAASMDDAVFTFPQADAPIARGSFRAPATTSTTEVRILGGSASAPAFIDAPAPAASSGPRTHTVQKGDNYWDLAKQYYGQGIRFKDIEAANPGKNPTKLQIGETLVIPE